MCQFFALSKEKQKKQGLKTRQACENNYQYDTTAKKWADYFDSIPIQENIWDSTPPKIHQPSEQVPQELNNRDLAKWLIINVLGDPNKLNSYMEARLIRDLNYGVFIEGTGSL